MSDDNDLKEAKKTLLAQARALDMKVDQRWSVETLAEKVLEAQEAVAQSEAQAVHDAADTWVFCIRDCFLATDKHVAGSVILAPKDLYLRWKATGAARLADEDEVAKATN